MMPPISVTEALMVSDGVVDTRWTPAGAQASCWWSSAALTGGATVRKTIYHLGDLSARGGGYFPSHSSVCEYDKHTLCLTLQRNFMNESSLD